MKRNFWQTLGIICGIIIIVLGIVMLTQDEAYTKSSTSFGADFYTYSYQATALAANNVKYLYDLVAKGIGYLLIALGMTDICLFGAKLTGTKESDEKSTVIKNTENKELAAEKDNSERLMQSTEMENSGVE